MWPLLGWFSGLMCVGSVAGAIAWGASMQSSSLYYQANGLHDEEVIVGTCNMTQTQAYSLNATSNRMYSAFLISYGAAFLCFMLSKLMLLGRLTNEASRAQMHAQSGRLLPMLFRAMAAAVVMCSVLSMVAYTAAGVYYVQSAAFKDLAVAACDAAGQDTNSSVAFVNSATAVSARGGTAVAVQNGSEAIALLLVSVAFVVLVTLSVAMFRRAEQAASQALLSCLQRNAEHQQSDRRTERAITIVDDTMHAAVDQRRRLVAACIVVLIMFPVRAAYDFLNAYASFSNPYNPACQLCDACQSNRFHVKVWLYYTPEFHPVIVALSSPLPLVLSLWLITAAHTSAVAIAENVLRARLGKEVSKRPKDPVTTAAAANE